MAAQPFIGPLLTGKTTVTNCQLNSLNVLSVSSYYLLHKPWYDTFQPRPSPG